MKNLFFKYKNIYLSIFIIIVVSLFFIFNFLQLKNMSLNIPLVYFGADDYFALNTAKTVYDTGTIRENSNLGAPFGTKNYDYPSLFLDNFDILVIKALMFFTHDIAATVNLQYILLFPFIAIISYFVMKSLKINSILSILGSLTFAFSPYIFYRGMYHTVLSTYQFVPLSILLCIWIYQDDNFFNINRNFIKYKKNYIAIFFSMLIANNGIAYYPFFTCFFLCVTGFIKVVNKKNCKLFLNSIFLVLTILIFLFINLIPILKYICTEGANPIATSRSWVGAEVYGLKIIQLFLPTNSHGIELLNKLITGYNTNAPLVNENIGSYLGIAGIIGFIILLCFVFIREIDSNIKENLKLLSDLNIAAVLLSTIGGFGSIFAIAISPMIRGYNRISIFILFISILAICLIIDNIYNRISKKKIIIIPIIILFSISILEQFPGNVPNYENVKDMYISDKSFINKIESSVSSGSMIFQLPYHQYPESGPVNSMMDYHLLTGYLHSKNLKWSYGGMKGRKSDLWNQQVSSLDTEDMIKTISLVGFDGIYIDKRAYGEDDYNILEQKLIEILQVRPLYSGNNKLSFFNMIQYNKQYKSLYSEDEISLTREKILNMNTIRLGRGFTAIEGQRPNQWLWLSNKSELIINNLSDKNKQFNMQFDIASTSEIKSLLEITINDKTFNYDVNASGVNINENIILNPGENIINFVTDAPRLYAPEDSRELYLKITNLNINKDIDLK